MTSNRRPYRPRQAKTPDTYTSTPGLLEVWTDGACSGNPGPGGYGWLTVLDDTPEGRAGSGAEPQTTNQRMELLAVIDALTTITDRPVAVVSDSTYVVNAFKQRWHVGWIARGWKNSSGQPVANQDLWRRLLLLALDQPVTFHWVKGHANRTWNEAADQLAVAARDGRPQPVFASADDVAAGMADGDTIDWRVS